MLEELGPTYVKLGQVLSTRPDLIPPEWADEFKNLQDNVPGVDFEVIQNIIQTEFKGEQHRMFEFIEQHPLAAASIAQVHRARLRNGTKIVLKVLRPNIREISATDMEILRTLAEKAESHFSNLGYSPTEVVDEFARELARELDLTHEGRATERFARLFEEDPDIVFPRVYWEATTTDILAIEEMCGLVLSRAGEDDIPRAERRRLVENGTRAVIRQCLEFGFFHADPHPGNLVALPSGRIAFIDCGMTGQLDARTTRQLADLVSGITSDDADRVVAAIAALADIGPETLENRSLRNDLHAIAAQFQGTPLGQLNLGRILQDFFGTLRAHHVRCPGDMVFLIKALTTIESVGRWLDPAFEIVEYAHPYVERLVRERYSVSGVASRLRRSLIDYAELFESVPGELRPLLSQLRRNKLAVNLEHRGLTRLTHTIEHASRNISFALIIAAVLVGSAILVHAAREPGFGPVMTIGLSGFVAAAALVFVRALSNRRSPDE
jgi:ubiquinone biosynthesis protein